MDRTEPTPDGPGLTGESENARCGRALSELSPLLVHASREDAHPTGGDEPNGFRVRYLKALTCWNELLIEVGTGSELTGKEELWAWIQDGEPGHLLKVTVKPDESGYLAWPEADRQRVGPLPGAGVVAADSVRVTVSRWDLPKWAREAPILLVGDARIVVPQGEEYVDLDSIVDAVPFYDVSPIS